MSIFPSTDIISDVARAADPHKREAAMKRLSEISVAHGAPATAFSAILDGPRNADPARSLLTLPSAKSTGLSTRPQPAKTPAAVAAQKFEAYILQSWLELLLPKVEGGTFGSGGAGNIWRSMMAEQLGTQLAKSGAIGIQRIIDKGDYSPTELRPLTPPSMPRA